MAYTEEGYFSSILELYSADRLDECQKLCEDFLATNPSNYYKWFCVFRIGLILKKRGQVKQAMKYAKSSLQYAVTDSHKTQVFWILGNCYEGKDKQRALKYYERALTNYISLGYIECIYSTKFNIAKVLNNTEEMRKNLELLESNKEKDSAYKGNDSCINQGYIELFQAYITRNRFQEAIQVINKVKDKEVQSKMITIMQQYNIVCVV